jgi:pimeloyl-ACP methyl ester carboxylesterase
MSKTTRLIKSFSKLILPVLILVTLSVGSASIWLVHEMSKPVPSTFLLTPQKYGQLSSRGAQITDENWQNGDSSVARGWLLRGTPNSPAVVVLYKYGANRSHVLNLAVKINEATNFTVLMPEQRGHGESPTVNFTSFGGCESDDLGSAIAYLRGLRTPEQIPLVGPEVGVYGLEMGALAACSTASNDPSIKVLALDSVPRDSDAVLASSVARRFPFASSVTAELARLGAVPYFFNGCYSRIPACESAKKMTNRKVMLLAGLDEPDLQDSTNKVARCFPQSTTVVTETGLSPPGFNMSNASIETSEAYDQRVIDFFRVALTQ